MMANMTPRKYFYILAPLAVIGMLLFVLYSGLSFNPYSTSIKMLNKPVPTVKLASLYRWNELINTADLKTKNLGHWYLINFWSSWCETCLNEQPFLMNLAQQGVTIYGFNYNDEAAPAKKWLESYGNPYQAVLWDPRSFGGSAMGVSSSPTTFLVDAQGVMRCQITGPLTLDIWKNTLIPIIEKNEVAATPSKK